MTGIQISASPVYSSTMDDGSITYQQDFSIPEPWYVAAGVIRNPALSADWTLTSGCPSRGLSCSCSCRTGSGRSGVNFNSLVKDELRPGTVFLTDGMKLTGVLYVKPLGLPWQSVDMQFTVAAPQ